MKFPSVNFDFKSIAKAGRSFFIKKGPTVSVVFGLALMTKGSIEAVKRTPQFMASVEEKKKELGVNKLTPMEAIKVGAPCYLLPTCEFITGTGFVLGGHYVSTRRATMAAAAYSMLEEAHKEYMDATKAIVGERKEEDIRDQIAKNIIEKNPPKQSEIIVTGKGKGPCIDLLSRHTFTGNPDTIRQVCNELNKRFKYEDFVPLEDYYYEIGMGEGHGMELAKNLGWHSEDGDITPFFTSEMGTGEFEDIPLLAVGFLKNPVYRKDTWR